MNRRLIFLAHAVAPGPAGAEALVNAELLRALAEYWPAGPAGPAGVTVISGGGVPVLADGTPVSALPGWRVHALGECGASARRPSPLSLLATAGLRSIRRGGPASVPARMVERGIFWRTGMGMKAVAWSRAAAAALRDELAADPGAVVYSRALPFASILAADTVRRKHRFLWIVNINDPLPPEVWPGQYAAASWANRKLRQGMTAALPRVDGFTFPSEQLRDIEASAFPEISRLPSEIVRHVAGRSGSAAPAAGGEEGTLRFAFAGTLRRDRCRGELREALILLGARLPGAAANIEVSFYLPHRMPAVADYAAGLPVRTRVVVGLRGRDLDGELNRADVLLNLESEVDRPLLMTKLASYSAFGKPVWSLCSSGGTTWQILGDTWGYQSALGEPETALEALLRIHGDWQGGRLLERAPSPAVAELFSPRRQVEALLRLAERIS
jgi:hypothetical protein